MKYPARKLAVNKIQGKTFTFDIRNLNAGFTGAYEVVATRNGTSDSTNYYIYRHFGGYFTCVAKTEAAKATCRGIGGKGGGWAAGSQGWAYSFD
ncbi:hypothetical protein [Elusimicrobium minutum]|uniref:hypothetical protein n=1 Tax=Elusimicrobium minutum TaxID=423605 RepID=UPI000313647F|nr:hypothetical protein [Elusimicrobium minutum]